MTNTNPDTGPEITTRSDVTVDLVDLLGSDQAIVRAARVSTASDERTESMSPEEVERFIDFLLRNRHGSPFEHVAATLRIECPIFVARELMRHRMASYNEMSGRYTQMPLEFYVPAPDRPLVQVGKAGEYRFEKGSSDQILRTRQVLAAAAARSAQLYTELLAAGVAREVARDVLPLSTYTQLYMTMNLRSMMNFLSLRTHRKGSAYPSFPLHEIEMVANKVEAIAFTLAPAAMTAFHKHGRVAP